MIDHLFSNDSVLYIIGEKGVSALYVSIDEIGRSIPVAIVEIILIQPSLFNSSGDTN